MKNLRSERMQTRHRFRLVVFDWDGTLLNSEARIVECLRTAGAEAGLPALADKTLSNVIGLGLRAAITALYPAAAPEAHARFVDRNRHQKKNKNRNTTTQNKNERELLEDQHQRSTKHAFATGMGRRGLDLALVD